MLFFAAVFLAIFGIIQALYASLVKDISLYFYEGRHDRARSTVELCLGIRAVSTFYSPANFGLFLAMVTAFALLAKDRFSIPKPFFIIGLFIIVFAGIQSISKIYLGAFVIILVYLLLRKRWRTVLLGLLLFILAFSVTTFINPYASHCFRANMISVSTSMSFYNQWLGPRFGAINIGKDKAVVSEDKAVVSEDKAVVSEDKAVMTYKPGYLTDAMNVVNKHRILGVGYISNVSSGDSMFLHLMVRGGIIGSLFFLTFLILLIRRVILLGKGDNSDVKSLREAWVLTAFIFLISGIGLPTFIQDRTGDVFWWTGALLAFSGRR